MADPLLNERWQCDVLLLWISPTEESEARRTMIFHFVAQILRSSPGLEKAEVLLTGSFAAKCYLPDSDIDLMLIMPKVSRSSSSLESDSDWVLLATNALCRAALASSLAPDSNGGVKYKRRPPVDKIDNMEPVLGCETGGPALQIRNTSFINANVKVVNCVVENLAVDVSAGRPAAVAVTLLLEECDLALSENIRRSPFGTGSAERSQFSDGTNSVSTSSSDSRSSSRNSNQNFVSMGNTFVEAGSTHLLKRSILLVKAWCLYESGQFVFLKLINPYSCRAKACFIDVRIN